MENIIVRKKVLLCPIDELLRLVRKEERKNILLSKSNQIILAGLNYSSSIST